MKTNKKDVFSFIGDDDDDLFESSRSKNKKKGKNKIIEVIENEKKKNPNKTFSEDAKEELTALQKENLTKEINIRTDCWVSIYFSSPQQLQEFLDKTNTNDLVEYQYINGKKFAKTLGIELESPMPKIPKPFRKPKNIDLENDIFEI